MDDSGRDHRVSTWRQGCPKLWKSKPNRKFGLSCGGLESFWSGKWCDNAITLEKSQPFRSFFSDHLPLIQAEFTLHACAFISNSALCLWGTCMLCASRCHWVCFDGLWYQFPGSPEQELDLFSRLRRHEAYQLLTQDLAPSILWTVPIFFVPHKVVLTNVWVVHREFSLCI